MIKSKRIRKLCKKLKGEKPVQYETAYRNSAYQMVIDGVAASIEEAAFKLGQLVAVRNLEELAVDEDIKEDESRKRQLIQELRNLGVVFEIWEDVHFHNDVVLIQAKGWPAIREHDLTNPFREVPYVK